MSLARIVCAVVVVLSGASRAPGHALVILRGTLEQHESDLNLVVQAGEHEFEHLGVTGGFAELTKRLSASLEVFTESGDPVAWRVESSNASEGAAVLALLVPKDAGCLVLRLDPAHPVGQIRHQLQLRTSVAGARDDTGTRVLRLTSDGNAEVVGVGSGASGAQGESVAIGERVRGARMVIDVSSGGEAGLRMELQLSAPVLDAWMPINRREESRVGGPDLESMSARLDAWVGEHVAVDADGHREALTGVGSVLLGPRDADSEGAQAIAAETICFWAARSATIGVCDLAPDWRDVTVSVDGMPVNVGSIETLVRLPGGATVAGVVSAVDPKCAIHRAPDGAVSCVIGRGAGAATR